MRVPPYARTADVYDDLLGDSAFAPLRRVFEEIERRHRLRLAPAADVGCGTGTFVAYLRARGAAPVWGVDRSPHMLARALAKNRGNGARFLLQDLRALRLPHQVALLTCQFDTLNYLLDPADLRTAFRVFARSLAPGGHTVFDMVTRPADEGPYVRLARVRLDGPGGTSYETHAQRAYSISEIATAATGSGLRLTAAHGVRGLPPGRGAARVVFVAGRE
ncbi:class I SAM-dependent methyltransferase [Streptomyces sp. NPDC001982]|uniref:class I SAM-dependent DNA methyltransferase n=1 Tax=Streptomyces sp. NPDC001982 TaxID=3154405 RepID=UPI0033309AFE